jgi:hypothetical protein
MGALSNEGEVAGLKYLTGQTAPTISALYLALETDAGDDTGAGTEVTGGSYARQEVAFAAPTAGDPPSTVSNSDDVVFTGLPACSVTSAALYSASTGGTRYWYTALSAPRTVNAGDSFTVKAGDLVLSLD